MNKSNSENNKNQDQTQSDQINKNIKEQKNIESKDSSSEEKAIENNSIVKEEISVKNEIETKRGAISKWLIEKGLENNSLEEDHLGVEIISIEPKNLYKTIYVLKENGFDYLQCQGGYDEGPGKNLVCFYHLISISDFFNNENSSNKKYKAREVRVKVFLSREGDLTVPSLYKLFKGSDWQERETFDMFGINFDGHPHPKRLLMPEDWKGWPLRKDYVQPDFYEMQDAY